MSAAPDQMVCAVLAAQAADLRERIAQDRTVALLFQATDALVSLSSLVRDLSRHAPALTPQCETALSDADKVNLSIDQWTFLHAQHQDIARQIADCVATALDRMAAAGTVLSLDDLAELYVSEDQRRLHAVVMGNLNTKTQQPPPE